jgi:threonine aldolase
MRKAMAEADVGDDVFGEDPSVNLLQQKVANLLGKEAALFVASGTMGNQLCIKTHTEPGNEVIIEVNAHPFNYEAGGGAALAGIQFYTIKGNRGIMEIEQIEEAIRPTTDHHYAPTRLICVENTHNRGGGKIYPLEKIIEIKKVADRHGISMHLDGARLMNACVATGIKPMEYAQYFDSVSICLSKGLGTPVGSVIAGSTKFIDKAHWYRKMYGGGMRQAGILAAAGVYALDHHVDRLAEDHQNAKILAQGLSSIKGIQLDPNSVETNIVIFDVSGTGKTSREVATKLREHGVLFTFFGKSSMRGVTHLDVTRQDVEEAVRIVKKALEG